MDQTQSEVERSRSPLAPLGSNANDERVNAARCEGIQAAMEGEAMGPGFHNGAESVPSNVLIA